MSPITGQTTSRAGSYARSSNINYYPWWSMDYFYLGYGYYPRYDVYYSPNFYPHYFAFQYSPWNRPWGYEPDYYAAWRDPYWNNRYQQFNQITDPDPPFYGSGLADRGTLGEPARMRYGEPMEDVGSSMRKSTIRSPGGSGSSMTVVSPAGVKIKDSRAGPARMTDINARVVAPSRSTIANLSRSPSSTTTPSSSRQSYSPSRSPGMSRSTGTSRSTGMSRSSGVGMSRGPAMSRPTLDRN